MKTGASARPFAGRAGVSDQWGGGANGNEDRLVGAAFKRSIRFFPKLLKPLCRRFSASRLLCESEDLVVDDVIAVAAPRVKHHCVVTRIARQKLRRQGEAF